MLIVAVQAAQTAHTIPQASATTAAQFAPPAHLVQFVIHVQVHTSCSATTHALITVPPMLFLIM